MAKDDLAPAVVKIGSALDVVFGRLRGRAFGSPWSVLFGIIAAACLVVLIITGVMLMFLYVPSVDPVRYHGSYRPLFGVEMSKAFASMLHMSFDVQGGLLLRQVHHWAALLLPAALALQLLSIFFTGAFRRPRQLAWVLLVGVFLLALAAGWSGYALPDDTLSGTGLRITEGVLLGIPLIGTALERILFGGAFPGVAIEHLYAVHLAVSVTLVVLAAYWIRLLIKQRLPQPVAPGRTESNLVGIPTWPSGVARTTGLFFTTAGVIILLGTFAQIAPIWLYGPSSPASASAGSQPDWYTAFLDGALRLVPPGWEFSWLGRTWTMAVIVPLAAVALFFMIVAAYPFVEQWISNDRSDHHLLDRPRNTPNRTGIGVAGMTFFGALWLAGGADIEATTFHIAFENIIVVLRCVTVLGPIVAYGLTRSICRALQVADHDRLAHGTESGVIVRGPGGGYSEEHRPLSPQQVWSLTPRPSYRTMFDPDPHGATMSARLRARLQRALLDAPPSTSVSSEVEAPDESITGRPEAPSGRKLEV
ncbi:cytochrome b N-terminal domain-containing protein [Microlunatus sp. Gsoil 973]|uniref:cytochrome bc1 complex cytochrome b subunit n=1 Tax=Microlunatus sp. Gsoil 973 TaxID=2672569 RepID=UPI0018A82B3A|nr:cytochrome b N-terminal domain-containing protein [Microlunatus sp. Gsoil 973]